MRARAMRLLAGLMVYGLAAAFLLFGALALGLVALRLALPMDVLATLGATKLVTSALVALVVGLALAASGRLLLADMRAVEAVEARVRLPPRAPMRRPPTSILRFARKLFGVSLFPLGVGAGGLALALASEVAPLATLLLVPCALALLVIGFLLWGVLVAFFARSPWLARRLALAETMGTYAPIYAPLYREADARAWIGLPERASG